MIFSMKFIILDWGADELEEEAKDLPIADLIFFVQEEASIDQLSSWIEDWVDVEIGQLEAYILCLIWWKRRHTEITLEISVCEKTAGFFPLSPALGEEDVHHLDLNELLHCDVPEQILLEQVQNVTKTR